MAGYRKSGKKDVSEIMREARIAGKKDAYRLIKKNRRKFKRLPKNVIVVRSYMLGLSEGIQENWTTAIRIGNDS